MGMDAFLFLEEPRYYDAPDGQKPVDKIVATSKKGFVASLVLGINDCLFFTNTTTALETANCMAYWIVPMVSMSASFSAVTYMSTKVRGKDDPWNYAAGAASCIPILHVWKKSTPTTIWGGLAMIAFAMLAKHKAQNGWVVFPEPKHDYGIYEFNFGYLKDSDKNFRSAYYR